MKLNLFSFVFLFFGFGICCAQNQPTGLLTDLLGNTDRIFINGYLSPVRLQDLDKVNEAVQYAEIRSSRPSFSWIVPGNLNNTFQTSYQVIVAGSYKDAAAGKGTTWDSKTVSGKQSTCILYAGDLLQPEHTYFWRVRVSTNTRGRSDWSEVKAFRTAAQLEPYASSYEQLRKTAEQPGILTKINPGTYLADFNKDAFGQLTIRLFSSSGLDTVTIHLGEILSGQKVNRKPPGTIRYQQFLLALEKGTHTYRIKISKDARNTGPAAIKMPDHIGEVMPFRYAEIEGYSGLLSPNDVARDFVHYPFDDLASSFKSSSERLNQIWDLSKYSMKATSFTGVYVDGDRERIPYEADALINQLGHYGVDREYSLARRSSEYLLKHPTWPTEWILQALIISWNDYLYTGDARSLAANYEILKNRTLLQLRDESGLINAAAGRQSAAFAASINFKDKIRDIVDWPLSETDGFVFTPHNAVTNAFHYRALVLMANIAEVLNNMADQKIYESEHQIFKKLYQKYFFNKQSSIYKDGDATMHSSLHTNMFALHFGLVPEQHKAVVLDFVKSRGMACSVYGAQFLMDALYDGGDGDAALDLLTSTGPRSWYNMISVGSTITLEAWDNKFKPNQDWNHAWGAAPANIIPRRLMGLRPLKPGFQEAEIRPQVGRLTSAEGVFTTIRGNIEISIQNDKAYILKFRIPANMEASVYLPVLPNKGKLTHNGKVIHLKSAVEKTFIYAGKVSSGQHEFILTQ